MTFTRPFRTAIRRSPLLVTFVSALGAQGRGPFRVEETTITDIHSAFNAKSLTCHALVQQYLRRIDAYDKRGPAFPHSQADPTI